MPVDLQDFLWVPFLVGPFIVAGLCIFLFEHYLRIPIRPHKIWSNVIVRSKHFSEDDDKR